MTKWRWRVETGSMIASGVAHNRARAQQHIKDALRERGHTTRIKWPVEKDGTAHLKIGKHTVALFEVRKRARQ